MSNIYPSAGGGETVNVTSSQPGASFTVVAHYPSTAASYSGTTSGSGAGSVAFTVANVPAYTMVTVDVTVGGTAMCSTSFVTY
ncbi:MAG TPA: hypothetical protein VET24_12775 [Actinomycetota bacterium]|nr:hypothetical protein [Actinomycetota bacterium]